ncbi:GTP cyclohydrolase II [Salix suchowensis]|nr:GTP cyclohydrolase II [Salix suchowensis]
MASIEQPKMNSRALRENDLLLVPLLSPSSGFDLMQNCDLPPPLKVFSGSDKSVISSMNRAFSMVGREHDHDDFDVYRGCGGVNYEKLELLKALRLSQTRARDAERKAASLIKERDCLFAYRQWVRLLEFQVLKAQEQQWKQQEKKLCCGCGRSNEVKKQLEEEDGSDDGSRSIG